MNSFLGINFGNLNPFPLKRRLPKIVLAQGKSLHIIAAGERIQFGEISILGSMVKQLNKPILLLAAPYIHTLVQETIHLKKSELVIADSNQLAFSRFEKENRVLESIPVNQQKAITSYSHLSIQGKELLLQVQQNKHAIVWYPAITFIIRQLVGFSFPDFNLKTLIFDLGTEALLVTEQEKALVFKHIYNWTADSAPNSLFNRIEALTANEPFLPPVQRIAFAETLAADVVSQKLLSTIFFSVKKSPPTKPVTKRIRQSKTLRPINVPPRLIMSMVTFLLLIWTIQLQLSLYSLKTEYTSLHDTVIALEEETKDLEQLANHERILHQSQAFANAIRMSRFDPLLLLKILAARIPDTAWFQAVTLSPHSISVVILDLRESDLTKSIETINNEIGPVQLEESIKTSVDGKTLFKRTINIKPLDRYDSFPELAAK